MIVLSDDNLRNHGRQAEIVYPTLRPWLEAWIQMDIPISKLQI